VIAGTLMEALTRGSAARPQSLESD
jgi:hypothetical protein